MNNFFKTDSVDKHREHTLWVEKYRPSSLDDFVGNVSLKGKVKTMLATADVPHLLFYGTAGTGKTTLAKMISKQIDCDSMVINASDENNVETVRTKIKGFATKVGFNPLKIVILDEADYLSKNAQAILRNLMEEYSTRCRFILTCNFVDKIIDPVISRCQTFSVIPPSKKEVAVHVAGLLKKEGVSFEVGDLATIINSHYPDMRKIINDCQRQSDDSTLVIDDQTRVSSGFEDKLIELLNETRNAKSIFIDVRQLIADNHISNFTGTYRTLFDRLDDYAKGKETTAILVLAEYLYKDEFIPDSEINFSACIIELLKEIKN